MGCAASSGPKSEWLEAHDAASGQSYYYNPVTKVAGDRWRTPFGLMYGIFYR